jgi:C-terminal processing protease CtpA/Prc
VGLADATGYFGKDPIYLMPKEQQLLGEYEGTAVDGSYTLTLPAEPQGRPFDVTTGTVVAEAGVRLFDIRLMSDVASRGYMIENEDPIASSMKIAVDSAVDGGTLIVWAADDAQQFPTARGADGVLFTADDPREALAAGYSLVNIDSEPFTITQEADATLDLITTGGGDVLDFTSLNCAELIPALVDRMEQYYPYTELHNVDWAAIRTKVLAASGTASDGAECESLIRDIGNAIPDGHMNFLLASTQEELRGTLGMLLVPTSDGQVVVSFVRDGSPADQAGIKPGAIITSWDGKPIQQALDELVLQSSNASTPHALLDIKVNQISRGKLGTTATVGYQNPGETEKTATLERVQGVRVNLPVDDLQLNQDVLPSGIGYIRLASFADYSDMTNFDKTLDRLIEANVPGIIIDIRGNGGGWSQISDALSSRFFDTEMTIGDVYTVDGRYTYTSRIIPRAPLYTGLVAVLVDENTVSAADLFSYTFKSTKRGLIVGHTPSAGAAGTVSGGGYYLPNDGYLQLPTGGFQDSNKQEIVEGTGVVPDLLVPRTIDSILSVTDEVLRGAEQALVAGQKP